MAGTISDLRSLQLAGDLDRAMWSSGHTTHEADRGCQILVLVGLACHTRRE